MFSRGQIIFAIVFFISFVIAIGFAYRKDKKYDRAFFKGSYKVLVFSLFIFVALYAVVKFKSYLIH